jgi:hypothetical protein
MMAYLAHFTYMDIYGRGEKIRVAFFGLNRFKPA